MMVEENVEDEPATIVVASKVVGEDLVAPLDPEDWETQTRTAIYLLLILPLLSLGLSPRLLSSLLSLARSASTNSAN